MPDTKEGREKQAANEERRQREREIAEEQARADEPEPMAEETVLEEGETLPEPICHIRGCNKPATFVVSERYREETGQGAVVAEAVFCAEHAAQEGPTNLEVDFEEYLFRVEPLPSENRA